MSRCVLIAENATGHGGDIAVAKDMISAAADAGCDYAKFQTYSLARLNPADPQADWLRQAHLDKAAHETLMAHCEARHIRFLSTPFDSESLQMLRGLGLRTFKIASSESGNDWWLPSWGESWYVSYPWGVVPNGPRVTIVGDGVYHPEDRLTARLTAIPLYPTPLEAVGRATLLEGWSDHGVGLDACYWALAQGVRVLECHLTLGQGKSRVMPFDKTPAQMAEVRRFADACETIRSGVATTYRERWCGKSA